jgi:hypothetical protein
MNADFHKLLDNLSGRAKAPNPEIIIACIDDSRYLALHNEERIAFENLCQNLFEWDFPLTKEDYAISDRLGHHYRFEESTWSFLANLIAS